MVRQAHHKRKQGRGRLSGIDLLPAAADPVIVWAGEELRKRERTQTEIYEEFFSRLEALKKERRGELDFAIPSFTAFNRFSIMQAAITRRIDQTREISASLAKSFDAKASDDLTTIAAEAIKTLVFELLMLAGEGGIDPKGVMQLGAGLRAANQAQGISTARRGRHSEKFEKDVGAAVEAVAKAKGLSAETAEQIKAQILGVNAQESAR